VNYQTIITPATLVNNLHAPNWLILDCRGGLLSNHTSYKDYEYSHILYAYCWCMDEDSVAESASNLRNYSTPVSGQVIEILRELGFDNKTQIILYEDFNSSFTDTIWLQLRSLGLQNVAVLQGGFVAWCDQNLPISINCLKTA